MSNRNSLSAKEAKALDEKLKKDTGIPALILMENAGRRAAVEALKILNGKKSVAVFCGKGNNGGDGFVCARHLLVFGIRPDVFLAGRISDVQGEARINLEILRKLKVKITGVSEKNLNFIRKNILKYGLIIDALLGVGLSGETRGIYRDLIGIINSSKAKILAVDIPSGLDATTGRILGACVKADKTVTFVAKKRGMVKAEGQKVCGKVIVADLGIPYLHRLQT
jgi:NAD(P)H-hydrate epimerase